ncbi:MAG TPA: hypothetical protein VGJ26_16155 [Pirellulales bacterium]|jgi:hypothetical protein
MTLQNRPNAVDSTSPWPLILCLIGVDYFSTLAYLPSIAAEAAGPLAPVAAGGVVLVTFLLAIPVYWYLVGRSPDGRGATGLLQSLIPGWRGKLVVLTLLGFAAADFVITRSLSLADAAIHLIHNPHGQRLLARLPDGLSLDDHALWPPLEYLLRVLIEPQVAITLGLSIASLAAWQFLKRGVTRQILVVTTAAVCCYLALTALVIGSGLLYISRHPDLWQGWLGAIFDVQASVDSAIAGGPREVVAAPQRAWWVAWLGVCLWSFPQMALGLSGFELIMTVVPRVSGGAKGAEGIAARVRNTRKLMVVAATIMAVYLVSAVSVTTLLVGQTDLLPGGEAQHRALAYLAHGGDLANGEGAAVLNPLFGHRFGDVFDLSSVAILCLAGATVTMGLQSLLPHYLNRLGMEVSWAGKVGVILNVMNLTVLLVTVVFRASPSSQQWAYATSVLMLLAGGALAAGKDLTRLNQRGLKRALFVVASAGAVGFFLVMTGLTVLINHSGLTIALAFVAAILISSFVSRWIRSTELRFEGFDFADEPSHLRWQELTHSGAKVLAPHRPGLTSLAEKGRALQREFRLGDATPVIFIEVTLGDPSNFYQKPLMRIEREEQLEVIRVSKCVSVSHVLAAICLELCRDGGDPPEIIFGWSQEPPLAANLNFLLLGEGNIPWMVKELVRRALPNSNRQPRVIVG